MKRLSFLLGCFCFTWNLKGGENRIWMIVAKVE